MAGYAAATALPARCPKGARPARAAPAAPRPLVRQRLCAEWQLRRLPQRSAQPGAPRPAPPRAASACNRGVSTRPRTDKRDVSPIVSHDRYTAFLASRREIRPRCTHAPRAAPGPGPRSAALVLFDSSRNSAARSDRTPLKAADTITLICDRGVRVAPRRSAGGQKERPPPAATADRRYGEISKSESIAMSQAAREIKAAQHKNQNFHSYQLFRKLLASFSKELITFFFF